MKQNKQPAAIEVTAADLPVHCPMADSELWNSHPRVYIPLEDTDEASCSYCGTVYRLVSETQSK